MDTVKRIVKWNEDRFDKEFNVDLANKLLEEELIEGLVATTYVEIYDSIGDQLFVAIGELWKAGILDLPHSSEALDFCLNTNNVDRLEDMLDYIIKVTNNDRTTNLTLYKIKDVMVRCVKTANLLRFNNKDVDILAIASLALLIVTRSNETKSTPENKLDSGTKANVDKGSSYVPPTRDLTNLIEGNY